MLHPLNNIEITNYFNHEPRFNGTFPRSNIPRINDGAYVKNFSDKNRKRANWFSLFIDRNTSVYFESFGFFFNLFEYIVFL